MIKLRGFESDGCAGRLEGPVKGERERITFEREARHHWEKTAFERAANAGCRANRRVSENSDKLFRRIKFASPGQEKELWSYSKGSRKLRINFEWISREPRINENRE